MKKIRVLHIITDLDIGGAEKLLADLSQVIDTDRFEMSVVFFRGSAPYREKIQAQGIPVAQLPLKKVFSIRVFFALLRLLRSEKPQIVHTHLKIADLYGIPAAFISRIPAIISTKHNTNYFAEGKWLSRKVDAWLMRRCDRVIAVSEAVKRYYMVVGKLDPSSFRVIRNGIFPELFDPAADIAADLSGIGIPDKRPFCLCAASLTEQKGHETLFRAWKTVTGLPGKPLLVLAGDGPLKDALKELTAELGIEGSVCFLGIRRDVPGLIRRCELLVLPSNWEGLGIVLMEAMAAGRPVIASAVDGIPEIVDHGRTGLLVPPRDPENLAKAIRKLLKNERMREEMGERGRAKARREFRVEEMVRRIEELYEEILHRKDAQNAEIADERKDAD